MDTPSTNGKILAGIERIFKTDIRYLASGAFWLTLIRIVGALASFASAFVIARYLPRTVYGQYQYVLAMYSLIAIAALDGINTSVIQAVARGLDSTVMKALTTKLRWGMLGSVASLLFAAYYASQGSMSLSVSFILIAAAVPLAEAFGIYEPYLHGKKAFSATARYQTAATLISTATYITAIILTKNLIVLVSTFLFTTVVTNLFFYFKTLRKFPPQAADDPGAMRYGKHLSAINLIPVISKSVDKLVVWHFLGAGPLAVYSFCSTPITRIQQTFKNIRALAIPKFSEKDFGVIKRTLPHKILLFFIGTVIIVAGYVALIPLFFSFFFPQYLDAVPYTQYLSLILLFYPFSMMNAALISHAKVKELYVQSTIMPVALTVLTIILTASFQLFGLITARLIANAIDTIVLTTLFIRAR